MTCRQAIKTLTAGIPAAPRRALRPLLGWLRSGWPAAKAIQGRSGQTSWHLSQHLEHDTGIWTKKFPSAESIEEDKELMRSGPNKASQYPAEGGTILSGGPCTISGKTTANNECASGHKMIKLTTNWTVPRKSA